MRSSRRWTVMPYIVSLGVGLGIGVIYALIDVRSPAPPLVALVGLLGMVLAEQAVLRMRGGPVSSPTTSMPDARAPTTSTPQDEHRANA
jgi:XapX domain-containing protein